MFFYINGNKESASGKIAASLQQCILSHPQTWSEIVFLCIGTDRMTGDCLGPYIGESLQQQNLSAVHVYGTLFQPVHALNLSAITAQIKKMHPSALVIAIDASLGEKKHIGYVSIGNGPLYPGSGIQKNLPPVGDIYITGIVNVAGILEQLTLQTTRLSIVIKLADKIIQGILNSIPCKNHLKDSIR